MEKSFEPAQIESTWYARWEASGVFKPSGQGEPYCILLPPPNVTGTLHMGHAFQQTVMDMLVRYHRMRGYDTLWQVGTDHAGIATEMVVSRNLAQQIDGGHALGKRVQVEGGGNSRWTLRIVGVVGDTYQDGPLHPQEAVLYVPLAQVPEPLMTVFRSFEPLRFAVRGHGNPADWQAAVHAAVAEVAPRQPIAHLRSMGSIVRETTRDARLSLWLIGLFAALALLLAAAGMYAVMAVAVAAREREFGVRLALGAAPLRLLRLVLRGGLIQIGIGLVLGVVLALALSGVLRAVLEQLNRSSAFDPLAVVGVCVMLAFAACWPACCPPCVRRACSRCVL